MQFRTERYQAPIYWFAVMMVAVFGTMAADGLHVALALPYVASSAFYAVAVAVVFTLWHRSEGTLSIHSIITQRRETYYWITVLATFALGTAVGDLVGISLKLGFFAAGMLFFVAILVPLVAWWKLGLNEVVAFWTAYVLTRPLGASFADWLGKPHKTGHGVGWGDGVVAGIATLIIAALVAYVALTRTDIQQPAPAMSPGELVRDPS